MLCGLCVAALAAGSAPAASAGSSARCPETGFLEYGGVVYASEPVPDGIALTRGEELGIGKLNRPRGANPCQREEVEVSVYRVEGVDPSTAVLVESDGGEAFILGGRCSGFAASQRWACVLEPLHFQGRAYVAAAYPADESPRGQVELVDAIGEGKLGDDLVTVRAIAGVDPAVAVGVEGRPGEAFLAPGVCPYERFSADPEQDDLATCLAAPLWLVFDPLGASPGAQVRASGDRAAAPELEGAEVGLVRLERASDTLPDPIDELTPIGTIARNGSGQVSLTVTVPDLEPGLYEAVIRCNRCAQSLGGNPIFAAGSISVLERGEERGGSSSAKIFFIAVFALGLLAIAAAVILWVKGHRPRFRGRPL